METVGTVTISIKDYLDLKGIKETIETDGTVLKVKNYQWDDLYAYYTKDQMTADLLEENKRLKKELADNKKVVEFVTLTEPDWDNRITWTVIIAIASLALGLMVGSIV